MELALLVALIVLNGLFAMSEIALIAARKSRLQRLAEDGDHSAIVAIRLGEEPTQFLSTIQIGITAIGILNGIVGEAALAGPLAGLLHGWGIDEKTSAIGATTIVVGELVPTKCIAQFNAISCPADRRPLAGYSISISKSYLCRLRKMLARRTICTPASHLPRLLGTFTLIWKRNYSTVTLLARFLG